MRSNTIYKCLLSCNQCGDDSHFSMNDPFFGFFTARRYAMVYTIVLCLCVSVTLRYCIKMAKYMMTQIMPHNNPGTLCFLIPKITTKFERGH